MRAHPPRALGVVRGARPLVVALAAMTWGCAGGPSLAPFASVPQTAQWQRLPPLPVAVRSAAAVALDGRIYVIGGAEPSTRRSRAVQIFDPSTGSWTRGPDAPVGWDFHTAVVLDGRIHVISGGRDELGSQRDHWVLDPRSGYWSQLASIPVAVNAAVAHVIDGKIYVFGGVVGRDYRDLVQVYDPAKDEWGLGGQLPIGTLSAVSAIVDGRVHLVGGGVPVYETTSRHLVFDHRSRTFESLPDYPHPMEAGGGGAIDGALCVFGGRLATQGRSNTPFSDTNCYVGGDWVPMPAMPTPRAEVAYLTFQGAIYAIGGDGNAATGTTVERLVRFGDHDDAYARPATAPPRTVTREPAPPRTPDEPSRLESVPPPPSEVVRQAAVPASPAVPPNASWEALDAMPIGVRSGAIASDGDRIYVIGGSMRGGARTDAVQILDLRTMRWRLGPRAPQPVDFATAAWVGGRLHLISGATDRGSTEAHWVLDPASGEWGRRASVPTPVNAAATEVVGGRIYVFGGSQGGRPLVNAVQIYDPATDSWSYGASMPFGRLSAVAAAFDGKIHLVGGGAPGLQTTNQHVVYDPAEDTFTELAPYPLAREAGGGGIVAGRLCVFGGRVARSGRHNTPEPSTYCYDLDRDVWQPAPPIPTARAEVPYVTVGEHVYAIGGDSVAGEIGAVERFTIRP